MKVKQILSLTLLAITYGVLADEVQLKNGRTWLNVYILEDQETLQSITIFTSMKKKIEIHKNKIMAVLFKEFDTSRKSELISLGKEFLKVVEEYYILLEGDSIDTQMNSVLVQNIDQIAVKTYSYRLAKTPSGVSSEVKDYINNLKKGFNYSIDLAYFFHRKYAIAINYSRFLASNRIDNIYYEDMTTLERRRQY